MRMCNLRMWPVVKYRCHLLMCGCSGLVGLGLGFMARSSASVPRDLMMCALHNWLIALYIVMVRGHRLEYQTPKCRMWVLKFRSLECWIDGIDTARMPKWVNKRAGTGMTNPKMSNSQGQNADLRHWAASSDNSCFNLPTTHVVDHNCYLVIDTHSAVTNFLWSCYWVSIKQEVCT